jgi:hypothetical protein
MSETASDPADPPSTGGADRGERLHRLLGLLPARHLGPAPACPGAGVDAAQRPRKVRRRADDRRAPAHHRRPRAGTDTLRRTRTRTQTAPQQAEVRSPCPTASENHPRSTRYLDTDRADIPNDGCRKHHPAGFLVRNELASVGPRARNVLAVDVPAAASGCAQRFKLASWPERNGSGIVAASDRRAREGPKVCRLPTGGRWIRTLGPPDIVDYLELCASSSAICSWWSGVSVVELLGQSRP